jgi:hypothetical protein
MTTETGGGARAPFHGSGGLAGLGCVLLTASAVLLVPSRGRAAEEGHCSATAAALFRACGFEVQDDHAKTGAKCINVSDPAKRAACLAEARAARRDGFERCRRRREWREDACDVLGEGRYDPDFEPKSFDDPRHPNRPNPYFPLDVGNRWEYRGATEVKAMEVLDRTKRIAGVTCLVVNDVVTRDGDVVEDTDDWFASAREGDVWYCGEQVKDFESFDGDDPRRPELVAIDGSFKAGRNRDQPGIIFLGSPTVGRSYREESSLGNAEDVTDVLSITYSPGADRELDRFVPPQLARQLCHDDCVVTRNYSLLEPGVVARKYYARDIGFFLEVKLDGGEVLQLVNCNFDARCATLPQP